VVVTDPVSATLNDSYMVRVASGTATIGGVVYSPSRFDVIRYYNGSAWTTQAAGITGGLTVDGVAFSAKTSVVRTLVNGFEAATAGVHSPIVIGAVSVGAGFPRPILFYVSGTYNGKLYYSSREQGMLLWFRSADSYWVISAALGEASHLLLSFGTSGTTAYIGSYVGAGTYFGTTVLVSAPTMAVYGTSTGSSRRVIERSVVASSNIAGPYACYVPPAATHLVFSHSATASFDICVAFSPFEFSSAVFGVASFVAVPDTEYAIALPAAVIGKHTVLLISAFGADLSTNQGTTSISTFGVHARLERR
jgi:hypothetical protein